MFLDWTGALLTYKRTDDDLLDNPPDWEQWTEAGLAEYDVESFFFFIHTSILIPRGGEGWGGVLQIARQSG